MVTRIMETAGTGGRGHGTRMFYRTAARKADDATTNIPCDTVSISAEGMRLLATSRKEAA